MHTAEFVPFIDSLFDSLNGSQLRHSEGKNLKCPLSKDSKSGQLRTNFKFVEG
jgi:hypothetical protein